VRFRRIFLELLISAIFVSVSLFAYIKSIKTLPMPEAAANIYGKLRSELEARGEMIGNNDLWIAAHTITAQAILVTNDESEFRRVRGLRLQNWAKP